MAVSTVPIPDPTPTSLPFWEALNRDELRLQRCDACTAWVYYPRNRCPVCGSAQLSWCRVDPLGTVYTFTVARKPTAPPFADAVPQVISIVELDIGVRMTCTLTDIEPDSVYAGLPVRGVFDHIANSTTLLRFAPRRQEPQGVPDRANRVLVR